MLSAGTSECNLQVRESARYIACSGSINQCVAMIEKGKDFAVLLKKFTHRGVAAVKLFVGLISPGVMDSTAVKDEAAAIARRILGQPLAI